MSADGQWQEGFRKFLDEADTSILLEYEASYEAVLKQAHLKSPKMCRKKLAMIRAELFSRQP